MHKSDHKHVQHRQTCGKSPNNTNDLFTNNYKNTTFIVFIQAAHTVIGTV